MSNQNWEKRQMEALFTVAEDIDRFAPWESNIAPFVLRDPDHPDATVLVVMGRDDAGVRDIRLILSRTGMRAWLLEDEGGFDDDDVPSIEALVNRYEGYYLEVGYNTPHLNNFEKRLQSDRHRVITFRRQRPGYGPATIVDGRDYEHLLRYLKAILKLLTRQMLGPALARDYYTNLDGFKTVLSAASFMMTEDVPEPAAVFELSAKDFYARGPQILDEFTDARVKHMPCDGSNYELYYFYLPTMATEKGGLARAFFLVDLDSGLLEWSDVLLESSDWRDALLRRLWDFFLARGTRPGTMVLQNIDAFTTLSADINRAGIECEYVPHSYVGQELFESYLDAAHVKKHQMMAAHFPKEPY